MSPLPRHTLHFSGKDRKQAPGQIGCQHGLAKEQEQTLFRDMRNRPESQIWRTSKRNIVGSHRAYLLSRIDSKETNTVDPTPKRIHVAGTWYMKGTTH